MYYIAVILEKTITCNNISKIVIKDSVVLPILGSKMSFSLSKVIYSLQ